MSGIERPSRPSVSRLPSLPSTGRSIELPTFSVNQPGEPLVDEFGLAYSIYGEYPRYQRRLVARFISHVGGNKRSRPPLGATIAEGVFFGLLLENGFTWTNSPTVASNEFRFQSYELGGRQPGGAVTDFYVIVNAERVAVRVQSAFHALVSPFGTGGQVNAVDLRLKQELLASVFIDRVVDVNRPPERVLETADDPTKVQAELLRVTGRLS